MPLMYWFSRRMTLWGSISFNLAVFINIIIAFFYPYVEATSMGECPRHLLLLGVEGEGIFTRRKTGTALILGLLQAPKAPGPFCWIKD